MESFPKYARYENLLVLTYWLRTVMFSKIGKVFTWKRLIWPLSVGSNTRTKCLFLSYIFCTSLKKRHMKFQLLLLKSIIFIDDKILSHGRAFTFLGTRLLVLPGSVVNGFHVVYMNVCVFDMQNRIDKCA